MQASGSKYLKHESNRLNSLNPVFPKIALRIQIQPFPKQTPGFPPVGFQLYWLFLRLEISGSIGPAKSNDQYEQ